MEILLFVVLFLVCIKWILLLILFFPVRMFFLRKKNSFKNDVSDIIFLNNPHRLPTFILKRYVNGIIRYYIFQVGYIPSHHIRNAIYKYMFCVDLEDKVVIYWGAEIREPCKLTIGKGSVIGDSVILDARNGIVIGENVNISSKVQIWSEQHDHRDPFFRCSTQNKKSVIIQDRVWLGPNVTILHSVCIGEGAVIAAGSVVTKSVEPFSIMAGIPAKKIGQRNTDLFYKFDGDYLPFY